MRVRATVVRAVMAKAALRVLAVAHRAVAPASPKTARLENNDAATETQEVS